MKMEEAMKIINEENPKGFRVSFEWAGNGLLYGDYFPARAEEPIPTEEEAWELATKFAAKRFGQAVNIYVIDQDYRPGPGYEKKQIKNR